MVNTLKEGKGYWTSRERFTFPISRKITDAEEFGLGLVKYLKWLRKEGDLPLKVIDIYPMFVKHIWDKRGGPRYQEGYVFLILKKKTIFQKANHYFNLKNSDNTIIIHFKVGKDYFTSFQECHNEYVGCSYRWKLPLKVIEKLEKILQKYAGGYWLGLHTLIGN